MIAQSPSESKQIPQCKLKFIGININTSYLLYVIVIVNCILVTITTVVGGTYYFYQNFFLEVASAWGALRFGALCSLLFTIIWFLLGGAKFNTLIAPARQIRLSVVSWVATYFVLAWASFLLQENRIYSHSAAFLCFLIGMVIVPVGCVIGSRFLDNALRNKRLILGEIAFIGVGDDLTIGRSIQAIEAMGFRVVSRSVISLTALGRSSFLEGCKLAASDILEALGSRRLDGVWILMPSNEYRHVDDLKSALTCLPLPVTAFAEGEIGAPPNSLSRTFGEFTSVDVQRAPLTRTERAVKRTLDISVASLALIVLSPLMFVATLAVLAETGRPILFRQSCKGFGGRPFDILKFRSMSVQKNHTAATQARRHDARVTRLGHLLRWTSIDELPQLINVLKGDMSIVGPRPRALAHDAFYDRGIMAYAFRNHVKPGIIGWTQANGLRGNAAELAKMEGRVEKELWYINHWSLGLDIRIIIRAAIEVIRQDKAY